MEKEKLQAFTAELVKSLNDHVFNRIYNFLCQNPSMRETLNPAFPFPKKIRVGVLDTHLVIEYLGPEDHDSSDIPTECTWKPGLSVLDFLGIDIRHLKCPRIPFSTNLVDTQVFLGDAMNLLGDYLYDVVANPRNIMLNGFPDFSESKEPIVVSNCSFLWSDSEGAIRIKHIDFLEIVPIQEEGWAYHTTESLEVFAAFLINLKVPRYRIQLHESLNRLIEMINTDDVAETNITRYLAEHPAILQLAFGVEELNPEVELEWQYSTDKPNLRPDFLPKKMDSYSDILEFKLPWLKSSSMVGTVTRRRPSSEIEAALAQIDEYADWCKQEVNQVWLETTKGIKINNPLLYMVIGHRSSFDAADRQRLRSRRNTIIFTYDEFVEMARMQLYRIR